MPPLRLIEEHDVTAPYGLAADEVLALRAGDASSPPTLRLYTYRSHAALVGRFQNVSHELHLDFCAANDLPVNRRPTGGGAIIMGDDQLGVALCLPGRSDASYGNARQLMNRFSQGLIGGLATFGIEGLFTRKNDIEVNGKKIAGLGIHRTATGGLLFHASLLVDLDVAFMLRVLNTPFEKISDKVIKAVGDRTTTVRKVLGRDIPMSEVRAVVADGLGAHLASVPEGGGYSNEERSEIAALMAAKYTTAAWVYQETQVEDGSGFARVKSVAGLIGARVTMAGEQLKALYLEGDFFSSDNAIAAIEGAMRWHPSQPNEILSTLRNVYDRFGDDLGAIPVEVLQQVIVDASRRARDNAADPYGCFVAPGTGESQPVHG